MEPSAQGKGCWGTGQTLRARHSLTPVPQGGSRGRRGQGVHVVMSSAVWTAASQDSWDSSPTWLCRPLGWPLVWGSPSLLCNSLSHRDGATCLTPQSWGAHGNHTVTISQGCVTLGPLARAVVAVVGGAAGAMGPARRRKELTRSSSSQQRPGLFLVALILEGAAGRSDAVCLGAGRDP